MGRMGLMPGAAVGQWAWRCRVRESRSAHARPGSEASPRPAQHRARPAPALARCHPAGPAGLLCGRWAACPPAGSCRGGVPARSATAQHPQGDRAAPPPAFGRSVSHGPDRARDGPVRGLRESASRATCNPRALRRGEADPTAGFSLRARASRGPERGRVPHPPDLRVRAARPRACPRPPGGAAPAAPERGSRVGPRGTQRRP